MAVGHEELNHRFSLHVANGDTNAAMSSVRMRIRNLAEDLDMLVPDGREKSLVLTKLEEVMFWSNAGIARHHAKETE